MIPKNTGKVDGGVLQALNTDSVHSFRGEGTQTSACDRPPTPLETRIRKGGPMKNGETQDAPIITGRHASHASLA
jgi:hypothetical protein